MEGEGLVASALPRRRAGAANGRARRRWMRGAMAPPGGREGTRQRRRRPEGGTRTPPRPGPGNRAETPGDHPPAHAEASPPNPGASPVCELKFHRGWFASARCKSGE